MNPPTVGHEKLIEAMLAVPGDHVVHLSHSAGGKRNPLSYEDKLAYAREAFGDVVQESSSTNIASSLVALGEQYANLVLVVGDDRVAEFSEMLEKYNERDFHFESWQVLSAGARRPNGVAVEGVSASMVREACVAEDLGTVRWCLPDRLAPFAEEIIEKVKAVHTVEESLKTVQSLKRRQARDVVRKAVSRLK
jgi:hypothetical protein